MGTVSETVEAAKGKEIEEDNVETPSLLVCHSKHSVWAL